MIHQFGDCELDTDRYELRVKGELKALEPQVFCLLEVLVENRDRVLTNDELIERVWKGRMVSDSTLVSRIKSARQAIGDSGERQALIQTVRGRGYRFVAPDTVVLPSEFRTSALDPIEPHAPTSPPNVKPMSRWAALSDWARRRSGLQVLSPRWLVVLFLVLVGVVASGIGGWLLRSSTDSAASRTPPSIAVLPFVDMSAAQDQAYFADGVAEEILNALTKVKNLRVVGRASSFAYKGKHANIKVIGEQLNVSTVLEGSIRRFENRVRITTQLIDTSSGYHLWSETYDRKMQDIFAIQDEIARAVVHRLNPELGHGVSDHTLVTQETRDLDAYRLYLQGRFMWKRRYGDNIANAIRLFQEAIARDPEFARAHSALAAAYIVLPTYTRANRAESRALAERTAHAALRLNPKLSEPHAVLGMVYGSRLQWRRTEAAFRRAMTSASVDPVVYLWYGNHLLKTGRLRPALAQYEKALSLDPAWGLAVYLHSTALYALGQEEAAIRGAERAVTLDYFFGHILLRNISYAAGDVDRAIDHYLAYQRRHGRSEDKLIKSLKVYESSVGRNGVRSAFLQETEALLKSGKLSPYAAFYRFYHAKEMDQAMALFDPKADARFGLVLRRMWTPYGRPFRTHPHFASIAANLNLIPYWRDYGWPDRCHPDPTHGVQCH